MRELKEYSIPFVGLSEGKHHFEFVIEQAFFDLFSYDDFQGVTVKVAVELNKKSTFLELFFQAKGSVQVACDVTNELYQQPIDTSYSLVVNFGDEYNNEEENILIIPYSEYQVDISHYIYEMIVLAVPIKRIHPGIEDGTLQSEVLDKLEEFKIGSKPKNTREDENIDPRWNKLKDIK